MKKLCCVHTQLISGSRFPYEWSHLRPDQGGSTCEEALEARNKKRSHTYDWQETRDSLIRDEMKEE